MKVAVLGATGHTGRSIVDGLLAASSPSDSSAIKFEITALTRPPSVDKPEFQELKAQGVKVVPVNLQDRKGKDNDDDLVQVLTGIDVVISAIFFLSLADQYPLADAAKKAGVKRFIPCNWQTPAPRGVMLLTDTKFKLVDHIQRLSLPYTVIDVGWWYQIGVPRVPSGRLDGGSLMLGPAMQVVAGGDQPMALTDLRDIGRFVARIIADDRTLNRLVLCAGDVKSQAEAWDLVERLSGEEVEEAFKLPISADQIETELSQLSAAERSTISMNLAKLEYQRSWGVRGDNTPENAKYLGYILARELYPDFEPLSLEGFIKEALQQAGEGMGGKA